MVYHRGGKCKGWLRSSPSVWGHVTRLAHLNPTDPGSALMCVSHPSAINTLTFWLRALHRGAQAAFAWGFHTTFHLSLPSLPLAEPGHLRLQSSGSVSALGSSCNLLLNTLQLRLHTYFLHCGRQEWSYRWILIPWRQLQKQRGRVGWDSHKLHLFPPFHWGLVLIP